MNLFRYVFQAFFQPSKLEEYLGKHPAIRARVAWTHLAVAAVWIGLGALVLYVNPRTFVTDTFSFAVAVALAGFVLYGITIIVGLACGGLSKRDSLLAFIVSTYWSMIVCAIAFTIIAIGNSSEVSDDLLGNAAIFSGLIIVTSIVVNLHGKTRGMRPAVILGLICALVMFVLALQDRQAPQIHAYREPEPSKRRVIDVEGTNARRDFIGVFPLVSQRPFTTRLDVDGRSLSLANINSDLYYGYSMEQRRAYMITPDLAQFKNRFPGPALNRLQEVSGKTFPDRVPLYELVFAALAVEAGDPIINEIIVPAPGFYIDNRYLSNDVIPEARLELKSKNPVSVGDDNIDGIVLQNKEILQFQETGTTGKYELRHPAKSWTLTLNSRPSFLSSSSAGPVRLSNVYQQEDYLYLYAQDRLYVVDLKTGRDLAADQNFSWYGSRLGKMSDAVATSGGVFSVSPSGYLFAPIIDNGKLTIYPQDISATQLRNFSRRILPFTFAFYLIVCTLVLCIGLYRIPFYLVESILQTFALVKIYRRPVTSEADLKVAPLLFDHVSTLPLPFSYAFLTLVARTDERQAGDLLMYLLENTQQKKLAARVSSAFLTDYPRLTFEWLNRLLKREKRQVFDLLNRLFKKHESARVFLSLPKTQSQTQGRLARRVSAKRISSLLDVYQRALSANPKGPMVSELVEAIKPFADENYRHARELQLTYEVLGKFFAYRNVQELADADLALAELQQISVAETLNVNLTDIWGIVIELASDLKNYDVVESFRDKQYYLSEARIKLYELTRRAQKNLNDPEATLLVEVVEKWQELIITEGKALRGPAELQLALQNKRLAGNGEWNNILVTVKNVGQSPAENIFVSLLENENVLVLENKKRVRLLGTGDIHNVEFSIMSKGNPSELRMYFDASFDDFERKGKAFTFADVIRVRGTDEEFKKIQNPYVVGIPLQSDKVFYGRRKVLDFALDNLRAGEQNNVLIFYGQRRIGKSSLLYRIKDSELKSDYLFVYIDCQGFADADTGKLLYRLCESIQLAAQEQGIKMASPQLEKFKQDTFIELDSYLNQSEEALAPRKLVLMLDEYEYLEYKVKDGSVSAEIFNKLRNLMQHRNKKMTFIFVGTHRLQELTSNYWSFLFNTALYYEIGPLGEPEARALITDPVKGYLRYDDLAVDKILRVTGMHPYFIQGSCRALVNYCNNRKKNYVTLTDVNEVMREAVESSTAHVKYLYQDYANATEQQILTFLARITDDSKLTSTANEISRFALENGFEFEPGPVQEILAGLKNKRLIREDGEMHEQFGFEYEFLRIWIREHIKIRNGTLITT